MSFTPDICKDWSAQWIWQEEDGPANSWVCFRKTFDADCAPRAAIAKIAVDSKYWLWINGQCVIFEGGLKRGPTPLDTYYDEEDISSYLVKGENTIALLVWHWGKQGFAHKDSGKGGMLFECRINGQIIKSDSTWKMKLHPAYDTITADPQPNYRLAEYNIRFDARKDSISGWEQSGYDDSQWDTPVEKGVPPIAPWNNMWKRSIPQWKNSGYVNYINEDCLPAEGNGTVITAKLPYNAQITPYLKVEAQAGITIDIRTDNYCGGGNGGEFNVRTEYITTAGVQEFEGLGWMNGHEVHYTIPQGVKILSLKYRETGYDTSFAGHFECSDTFLNTLWEKSLRTLYVTMRDNYMDCLDRERAQWWGDAVIEIGEAFYALDRKADALARKAISNLVQWQRPDNTLYSPVPDGNWDRELPAQMLASIGLSGFWTYYMYTGDRDAIEEAYDKVKKYLNIWTLDNDGLVIHRTGAWDWADWGENVDYRALDNAWYYMALKAAVKMAELIGETKDIADYSKNLKSIEDNYNRVLWNGDHYRSPGYEGDTDDRANALAVIAGLADNFKWEAIRNVMAMHFNASPYMEKYVLESLFVMGYEQDALSRMKTRYHDMVNDSECSTLWELWTKGGWSTYNHAWTGGPLTLLSRYAAGVAPVTPGYGIYSVLPQEGQLDRISVVVPSIKGNIHVDIDKKDSSYQLRLISPRETTAIVGIPKGFAGEGKEIKSITLNGHTIYNQGTFNDILAGVRSEGGDTNYYKFVVQPGNWKFEAKAQR